MRGSVYYQTAQLTKAVFIAGAKKKDRTDPDHPHYNCVASYRTMETYRSVWNNFGAYLREHWGLKDFERIDAMHVEAYLAYKIEYYPTKLYAAKLNSAMAKLEFALWKYTKEKHGGIGQHYDFSVRHKLLAWARKSNNLVDGYRDRKFSDPWAVVNALQNDSHRIAAAIQLSGGARAEGVTRLIKDQLLGFKYDPISGTEKGVIVTREKGGRVGNVYVDVKIYEKLRRWIEKEGVFRVNYRRYAEEIRRVAIQNNENVSGSHCFRWNYAAQRVIEYQIAGYTYDQALQGVSMEMKHWRRNITEHYLSH